MDSFKAKSVTQNTHTHPWILCGMKKKPSKHTFLVVNVKGRNVKPEFLEMIMTCTGNTEILLAHSMNYLW